MFSLRSKFCCFGLFWFVLVFKVSYIYGQTYYELYLIHLFVGGFDTTYELGIG